MSKPAERKVIFELRVFAQPAQSRAVECNQIRRAAQLALQLFGAGVGAKLKGEIEVGYDQDLGAQVVVGDYEYRHNAPP